MNIEFGYSPVPEKQIPLSFVFGMDVLSRGDNRQQKKDKARAFRQKKQPTLPSAIQPEQPIKRVSPQHYLEHGGGIRRSQRHARHPQ